MVQYFLAAMALVAGVHSLPLNINLGAYSPALVVGDGEISFGGRQDVSSLMNVLEGAAVNAAAGAVAAAAQPSVAEAPVSIPAPVALAPADANLNQQVCHLKAKIQDLASLANMYRRPRRSPRSKAWARRSLLARTRLPRWRPATWLASTAPYGSPRLP